MTEANANARQCNDDRVLLCSVRIVWGCDMRAGRPNNLTHGTNYWPETAYGVADICPQIAHFDTAKLAPQNSAIVTRQFAISYDFY